MKREALIRQLTKEARQAGVRFEVNRSRGKGGHWLVTFGERKTVVQSGELGPLLVKRIRRQLGLE